MQTLNYKQIQKIEISATEKLLNYISSVIEFEDYLGFIEFPYPDFDENKYRIAFNIWLSIDFITKNNRTFIDNFLDDKSNNLTEKERDILIERKKSHISLFEIKDIQGESVEVLDLLQHKSFIIKDMEAADVLSIDDVILGRIGNLLGQISFIGDLNYLPPETMPMFLKQFLVDFNKTKSIYPNLTTKEYLKQYSLNLYKFYTNCIFEAMEMEDDIASNLYDELDEFESYLNLGTSDSSTRKYVTVLMDFFEYYLEEDNLTLYDLIDIDLKEFFKEAIKDGFIACQEDLNSYISTFKKYLKFLSNVNPDYKPAYKNILDISRNRFKFINMFKFIKPSFSIDQSLSRLIAGFLNEEATSILMDFDKFLLYIIDEPLELTAKNKYIKRKTLYNMVGILETEDYPNKKAPNQEDFPIIHLFFNLAIYLDILFIDNNSLKASDKSSNYLRLRDEEKYSLFFQFIWDNDFISKVSHESNKILIEKFKKDLVDLLAPFVENMNYSISTILPSFSGKPDFLFEYYFYLQYLGVLKCSLYPNYEIQITSLGKSVIEYLHTKDEKPIKSSVIYLKQFNSGK